MLPTISFHRHKSYTTHTHTYTKHPCASSIHAHTSTDYCKFTARVQLCSGQAKARKTKCDDNHYREDAVGRLFYEGRTAEINERQLWLNRRNPRVHHHLPTSVT